MRIVVTVLVLRRTTVPMMLLAGLLLALNPTAVDELYTLETPSITLDAPALPGVDELTGRDDPQAGGTCPSHAPLDCGTGCCPNSHPYCCPGNQCGSESSCGTGGGGGGGGGGGCDPGEATCDGGCCPSGSVCGTPGTNTCCPSDAPYHCASAGTCSTNSSDPCGSGGGGGSDPTGGGGGGGSCDPGATPCDGGCCPSGSVCGTPGTNTCCPSDAPYHCASEGTCSTNASDPCGGGGGGDSGSGGGGSCSNTCQYANDGDCDDGGPGSDFSLCDYGTDCGDCGPRDGSGGGCGGGGGTCSGDASGYPGLPADIQIWSQCAAACSYCGVGNQEAVDATCSILAGWDPSYPGACSYCNQDCSTPSGDQGDPGSVSTDNDDSAGLCSVGRSNSPLWGGMMLMVLFGLRRRRSA